MPYCIILDDYKLDDAGNCRVFHWDTPEEDLGWLKNIVDLPTSVMTVKKAAEIGNLTEKARRDDYRVTLNEEIIHRGSGAIYKY